MICLDFNVKRLFFGVPEAHLGPTSKGWALTKVIHFQHQPSVGD